MGLVRYCATGSILTHAVENCHESGRKIGPGGPILATKSGPAGPKMTPKFVRLIQNWSGHINTSNTWRLVLFYVKMDFSSDDGDAKNGNLVEEAYEYLVRNVYPVGTSVQHASDAYTKEGSKICCER